MRLASAIHYRYPDRLKRVSQVHQASRGWSNDNISRGSLIQRNVGKIAVLR